MKPVTDAIEEIQSKQRRAFDKLSGASQQLEVQRTRHLQDAQSIGLAESDMTLDNGQRLAAQILSDLKEACLKSGLRDPELAEPETVDDLERMARKMKEVIRDCRLGASAETSITAVSRKLADIEGAKAKIESATLARTLVEQQLSSHEKVHGSDGEIDKRKADLESKRSETRGAIAAIDATTRLLGDAIEVIRSDPSMKACPVCGQQVQAEKVIESLDSRLHGSQRAEHDSRVVELDRITGDLDAVIEAIQERGCFRKVFSDADRAYDQALADARRLMPELPDRERALPFVEVALRAARDELDSATLAQSERSQALDDLDQSVDRLRALQKIVKDDEESAQLSAKSVAGSDGDEQNALNAELLRLGELQQALLAIARAVQDVARARAGEAIEGSRTSTSDNYRTICNHPYFDRLRIEALEKSVAGVAKNNYVVRACSTSDGRDTLAGSRLSTAQMNCVALSIYLALAGVLTHNLDFIVLDDPSQNLDTGNKKALASLLKGIGSSTQLVVSSYVASSGVNPEAFDKKATVWSK